MAKKNDTTAAINAMVWIFGFASASIVLVVALSMGRTLFVQSEAPPVTIATTP